MDEIKGFHDAMAASPHDATVRLVYADKLDEEEKPEAARRTRWWAGLLPKLPASIKSNSSHVTVSHLPGWVRHLLLQYAWRTVDRTNRVEGTDKLEENLQHALTVMWPHDELAALHDHAVDPKLKNEHFVFAEQDAHEYPNGMRMSAVRDLLPIVNEHIKDHPADAPAKLAREKIPGGKARRRKVSDFPREKLLAGAKIEREHTVDAATAVEIAMDHLTEDIDYYEKLKKVKLAREGEGALHPEQKAFHDAMARDPNDAHTRAVYADWLDEHGHTEAAKRLRWWASVLPHLIHEWKNPSGPNTLVREVKTEPWQHELATQRAFRDLGKVAEGMPLAAERPAALHNYAQSELEALGLPREPDKPTTYFYTTKEFLESYPFGEDSAGDRLAPHGVHDLHRVLEKHGADLPHKLARMKVPAEGAGEGAVHPEQQAFHDAMARDPNDAHTRAVYADWLEENDQHEAARRLRWWASVLPHMPAGHTHRDAGREAAGNEIRLPQWASRLAISHFFRTQHPLGVTFGTRQRHAQDELATLGLAPEVEVRNPRLSSDWTSRQWTEEVQREPRFKYTVLAHPAAAQEIAARQNLDDPHRLARMKVPAGGQITGGGTATGGTFQQGGQFAAKARKRIRDVVLAWLRSRVQLARKAKKPSGDLKAEDLRYERPAGELEPTEKSKLPTTPAFDQEIKRVKDRSASESAGGDPKVVAPPEALRSKLTIRELRDVEDSLQLPPRLRLSQHKDNASRGENEEVADLDLDDYYDWANAVSRHVHKSNIGRQALKRLRDPKHLSRAKLAFLVAGLAREVEGAKAMFADTGGAANWYGDHVAVMARHLHDSFHSGKPEDDELWGKLDEKTGRVSAGAALTLSKILVAVTSGGMKPHDNYRVAHAMITAGRKHGAGSANPFAHIPDAQHDAFAAWVDAVEKWHEANKTGVTRDDILKPGRDLKGRALWFERVVSPLPKELSDGYGGTNNAARYSGVNARFVTDRGSEHYGAPVWVDKAKQGKRTPYERGQRYKPLSRKDASAMPAPADHDDYSAFLEDTHPAKGQIRAAKLPAVDEHGRLQPPGWTNRNEQVMDGVQKINAVVAYFTHTAKGDAHEGMKRAAEFFLNDQTNDRFAEVIKWVAQHHDKHVAVRLGAAVTENRGFYYEGEPLPGAFLLGPKFGAFSMNLHLDQPREEGTSAAEHTRRFGGHLTADLWWSRDWNVMLGTLFEPDDSRTKRRETPRGKGANHPERKLMRKAAQLAAERTGLDNVAQLQAVLWYYEQHKPRWFGVPTSSTSYLDGVNEHAGAGTAIDRWRHYSVDTKTGHVHVKSTF